MLTPSFASLSCPFQPPSTLRDPTCSSVKFIFFKCSITSPITILGQQTETNVKSISEREGIRQRCLIEVNALLYAETGKKPVEDLLFTKYLYQ